MIGEGIQNKSVLVVKSHILGVSNIDTRREYDM